MKELFNLALSMVVDNDFGLPFCYYIHSMVVLASDALVLIGKEVSGSVAADFDLDLAWSPLLTGCNF